MKNPGAKKSRERTSMENARRRFVLLTKVSAQVTNRAMVENRMVKTGTIWTGKMPINKGIPDRPPIYDMAKNENMATNTMPQRILQLRRVLKIDDNFNLFEDAGCKPTGDRGCLSTMHSVASSGCFFPQ
jgi:hypothetical protein